MKSVRVRDELPIDAAQAWALVRAFDDLSMYAGLVESCEAHEEDGVLHRVVHLAPGGWMRQRLESRDDAARTLVVRTLETDLPVDAHVSTISITESGPDTCEITFEATLEPSSDADVMAALVRDLYLMTIARFKDHLARGG